MKEKEEKDITAQCMLEEENLKRVEDKKMKAVATIASKEEANMTANAPTADVLEEEVRGGNENNQETGGMKDNGTHSNINNHMKELNSGAGTKDNDTDKTEEDPPPRKKKSRERIRRGKRIGGIKKNREVLPRTQSPPPQSLRKVDYRQRENNQTKLHPLLQNKLHTITRIKRKVIKTSIVLSGVDKYMEFTVGVPLIFIKMQVVDKHLVFEPVNPRNMPLLKPVDIPFYRTEMGEHI